MASALWHRLWRFCSVACGRRGLTRWGMLPSTAQRSPRGRRVAMIDNEQMILLRRKMNAVTDFQLHFRPPEC